MSAITQPAKAEKISQNTKGAAFNYVNQKAKKARKSTGKHLKMTKKEPICLHKTERLAAALKYCELRSGKVKDKTRYVGIWHAVYTNRRATLPQGD